MYAKATFAPAAASHDAGDVNGGAQEFRFYSDGYRGADYVMLRTVSLLIAGGTIETTAWTLHLYNVTPPSAIADDGAFDVPAGDRSAYLGQVAIAQVVDLGSTLYIEGNAVNKPVPLLYGKLFGYLVNGTTLTPQNVAHDVTLYAEPILSQ